MTLIVETHSWRGFSFGRDLFLILLVAGWITIGLTRHSVLDRLRELTARLRALVDSE